MANQRKTRIERLHDEAYAKYQLLWMLSHGHSVTELVQSVFSYLVDGADPEDDETTDITQIGALWALDHWAIDSGFGGEVWACKDEFLGAEYQDRTYVTGILDQKQLDLWDKEHGL